MGAAASRYSRIVAGCALALTIATSAIAEFPDRTIRIIVESPPGGSLDAMARIIAPKLGEELHQSVVVENRPGMSESIAGDMVAHAPPDGYMLLLSTGTHTIPNDQIKLNFDPITSFTPIINLAYTPMLLVVNPTINVKSVKELLALAKAKPGQLNFGSGGTSTPTYMDMELLLAKTGTNMVNISYKGGGPTVVGLLGNEIQATFGSVTSLIALVQSDKVVPIGVSTAQRYPGLPNVPTIAEAAGIPDFEGSLWFGVMGPAGMPKEIVTKLHDATAATLTADDVKKAMDAQGFIPIGSSPQAFGDMMKQEVAKWAEVRKGLGGK